MSSTRRGSPLLTLCLASVTIATWTPCSFDAWVLSLQNCSQSCYGEAFYDTTYNTTACGDYGTVTNSTKQSEVKCLCDNEYYGGAAWNLTSCWATECGKSFNETGYADDLVVYSKMCLWADGKLNFDKCA
jgi:hypothetical protein